MGNNKSAPKSPDIGLVKKEPPKASPRSNTSSPPVRVLNLPPFDTTFEHLPVEIKGLIWGHLEFEHLLECHLVSKSWKEEISDDGLWMACCKQRGIETAREGATWRETFVKSQPCAQFYDRVQQTTEDFFLPAEKRKEIYRFTAAEEGYLLRTICPDNVWASILNLRLWAESQTRASKSWEIRSALFVLGAILYAFGIPPPVVLSPRNMFTFPFAFLRDLFAMSISWTDLWVVACFVLFFLALSERKIPQREAARDRMPIFSGRKMNVYRYFNGDDIEYPEKIRQLRLRDLYDSKAPHARQAFAWKLVSECSYIVCDFMTGFFFLGFLIKVCEILFTPPAVYVSGIVAMAMFSKSKDPTVFKQVVLAFVSILIAKQLMGNQVEPLVMVTVMAFVLRELHSTSEWVIPVIALSASFGCVSVAVLVAGAIVVDNLDKFAYPPSYRVARLDMETYKQLIRVPVEPPRPKATPSVFSGTSPVLNFLGAVVTFGGIFASLALRNRR